MMGIKREPRALTLPQADSLLTLQVTVYLEKKNAPSSMLVYMHKPGRA